MPDPTGKETCPNCGNAYKGLGHHWAQSSACGYPDIPSDVQDVLRGLLLTGGTVMRVEEGANSFVSYGSSNREFLDWVRAQVGVFAGSIVESENRATETVAPGSDESDWERGYQFKTKTHPQFVRWLGRWRTSDGTRRVPSDVRLRPEGLRVAYAATGRVQPIDGSNRATLSMTRSNPSEAAVQSAFDGYAPYRSVEADRITVVLRNSTAFFDDIGWEPPSFATDRWPDDGLQEPPNVCPTCRGRFAHVGKHWNGSDCNPE